MTTGKRVEKGNFLPPEFPTPYLGPSEGIPQEADNKLILKFNQEEKQSLV